MDSTKSTPKLRVAIIGAGIGGLTLSSALGTLGKQCDLEIDVYEAAAAISAIGAGINFWPRTWKIMREIGLEQNLLMFLDDSPTEDYERLVFSIRKSDQLSGVNISNMTMKGGSVRIHRADLQETLLSKMCGHLHLSHRLLSYEETEKEVTLHFANGQATTCDLLIGMDGIKSAVRRNFLQKQSPSSSRSLNPIWSGTWAYRGLIPSEILSDTFPGHRALNTPMLYMGKLKHLVTYPVSGARLVNVVAMVTEPSMEDTYYDGSTNAPCEQAELFERFKCWEPEVKALLECIKRPTKWALQSIHPLNCYAIGRIALAGDAAHAMLPHQGAGAGQAIEDAYILAHLLCHTKTIAPDMVPKISDVYNRIRCPEGNRVLEGSKSSGYLSQLVANGFEEVVEGDSTVPVEKLRDLTESLTRQWDWTWKESATGDRDRALQLLKQL